MFSKKIYKYRKSRLESISNLLWTIDLYLGKFRFFPSEIRNFRLFQQARCKVIVKYTNCNLSEHEWIKTLEAQIDEKNENIETRQNVTRSYKKRVYLMKKVIILKKIQVTTKTFVPPFFNNFSLSMNRKQRVRAMRKKKTYLCFSCQFITY